MELVRQPSETPFDLVDEVAHLREAHFPFGRKLLLDLMEEEEHRREKLAGFVVKLARDAARFLVAGVAVDARKRLRELRALERHGVDSIFDGHFLRILRARALTRRPVS